MTLVTTPKADVFLLGTAHVSESSANDARTLIRELHPHIVMVELDPARAKHLMTKSSTTTPSSASENKPGETSWSDILTAARKGGGLALFTALLTRMYGEVATQIDVIVGAEQIAAMETAREVNVATSKSAKMAAEASRKLSEATSHLKKLEEESDENIDPDVLTEAREAVEEAQGMLDFAQGALGGRTGIRVACGDRALGVTLRRLWASLSLWEKVRLLWWLLQGAGDVSKEDVEELKKAGAIEMALVELRKELPSAAKVLITERDAWLAASLRSLAGHPDPVIKTSSSDPGDGDGDGDGSGDGDETGEPTRTLEQAMEDAKRPGQRERKVIIGVLGAGHVPGIQKWWSMPVDRAELNRVPQGGRSFISKLGFLSVAVVGISILIKAWA